MSVATKPVWETTAVQNLIRYRPAGTYFARFKVNGKPIFKSLKTIVFSLAKQRLPDTIREHRAKLESGVAVAIRKMRVGDAVQVYLEKVRSNISLKPRSKDYRDLIIDFITRSWPTLGDMDVRRLSERNCQDWLAQFEKQHAPSLANNAIGTLRSVFAEAVDSGARFGNPAADLHGCAFARSGSSCLRAMSS